MGGFLQLLHQVTELLLCFEIEHNKNELVTIPGSHHHFPESIDAIDPAGFQQAPHGVTFVKNL